MVDWNKKIDVRIEWFFALIIVGIIIVVIPSAINQPKQREFISNAVSGLVTISGVMTAFIGLWITHIIPAPDEETKRLLPKYARETIYLWCVRKKRGIGDFLFREKLIAFALAFVVLLPYWLPL